MRIGLLVSLLVVASAFAGCTGAKDTSPQSTASSTTSSTSISSSTSTSSTSPVPTPLANRAPTTVFAAKTGTYEMSLRTLFSLNGSDPDGDLLRWVLDFGDNTTQRVGTALPTQVNHTYQVAGTYNATLSVSDGKVSVSSLFPVTANAPSATPTPSSSSSSSASSSSSTSTSTAPTPNTPPTAKLTANRTSGTAPASILFTVNVTDSDGDPLNWTLSFGDGTNTTGMNLLALANVTKEYSAAGTYVANLTVTDGRGGLASNNTTITVTAASGGGNQFVGTVTKICAPPATTCTNAPTGCPDFAERAPGEFCVWFPIPASLHGKAFTVTSTGTDPDIAFSGSPQAPCSFPINQGSRVGFAAVGPEAGTIPAVGNSFAIDCVTMWEFTAAPSTITFTWT